MDSSYDMCSSLIEKLMVKEKEEYITSARNSQSHDIYSKLHYNTIPTLIQNYKSWPLSLIIKAGCRMLNINVRAFLSNTTSICSICNLHAVENTLHFIGICPIYKSFRLYYFHNSVCIQTKLTLVSLLYGNPLIGNVAYFS